MRISIKCSWPQLWAAILEGTQSWQCFPCSCQLLMLSRIHERYFRSFTRLLWKPAFHPEWKKKKILSLVAHVLHVCICRVWRWEVRFFSGAAVAPAVLQVLALLRVAGGLWLFPRPRSDSVHRLQQRRLTLQGHGKISKSAAASRRKLLTLSFAHAVSTITQPKAEPKLSFYDWNQLLAHGRVCLDAESLVYYLLFFSKCFCFAH